jgi:glycosyltransferase involved in cell wall biosynthesis
MDGIEWRRAKWGAIAKIWFWLNERAGCWLGNHLVADHPEIAAHLATRTSRHKITMVPYGAYEIRSASTERLTEFGLAGVKYLTVIARAEPENSLLEIVEGFSRRPRGLWLVVLGKYDESVAYHRAVLAAAGPEVRFVGAIYDTTTVQAIRYNSVGYIHGHQVGGTNPSLVEALGAGNAVFAHDNEFNRWVAGPGAVYFTDADSVDMVLTEVTPDSARLQAMRDASRSRFNDGLTWAAVLRAYEELFETLRRAG